MLKDAGWRAALADRGAMVHAKMMIIDAQVAIVGSHNLTTSALMSNTECSLVTSDPVAVGGCIGVAERLYSKWLK